MELPTFSNASSQRSNITYHYESQIGRSKERQKLSPCGPSITQASGTNLNMKGYGQGGYLV